MQAISLPWKEYNVDMNAVSAWAKTEIGGTFAGISCDDNQATLWFNSEISDMQKQLVQDFWDDLTLESPEVTSYVSQANINDAIKDLRTTMITKTWDELTVAERKLIMGQTPTLEELGLA